MAGVGEIPTEYQKYQDCGYYFLSTRGILIHTARERATLLQDSLLAFPLLSRLAGGWYFFFPALLLPQGFHGVDGSRPPRRNVTRQTARQ
jgi:hypothetical protein